MKDVLSESKLDPCGVCGFRVKVDSVVCVCNVVCGSTVDVLV